MTNGFFFDLWFLGIAGGIALAILIARAVRRRVRRPWWRG